MSRHVSLGISYFGKIPGRGDFVRHGDNHQLIAWLDRWAGEGVELMSQVPDWKRHYDAAPAGYFAFLGSRSRTALCGYIRPSHDSSGRRFPILSAVHIEVSEPLPFIGRSALLMQQAWVRQSQLAIDACMQEDATPALLAWGNARIEMEADPQMAEPEFSKFLETMRLGDMEMLLRDAGHRDIALRQVLPALGLLLQPLLAGGDVAIDKALVFPLPRDPASRFLMAAFWLDLLANFVSRADFELAVLISASPEIGMLVGFNGADRQILRAAMDPLGAGDFLIHAKQAEWVEAYLAGDFSLNRLAGYLDHPDLSLASARKLFGETFLGV